MAARRSRARTTTTRRTTTSRSGGGGLGRILVPVAILGGITAAILLLPRLAQAGQQPAFPPAPPGPNPLPPPPGPGPAPAPGIQTEPVADAPLPAGARLARTTGSDVNVRSGPGTNTTIVSRLPRGAGVAIIEAGPPSPGPGSGGWWRVRTSRGIDGYVAQELIQFVGGGAPNTGFYPNAFAGLYPSYY